MRLSSFVVSGVVVSGVVVCSLACLWTRSVLAGEVVLKNDSFDMMANLVQESGFISGEGIGESFTVDARYKPFRIVGVEFVAGGGDDHFTARVYKDTGAVVPGTELGKVDQDVTGSDMFIQRLDFPAPIPAEPGMLRVALFAAVGGMGGATFTHDPNRPVDNHSTLCAIKAGPPCNWVYAKDLGIKGTWMLRLVIDSDQVATPDGGTPGPDMAKGGGADGGTVGGPGDPIVDSITPSMVIEGMGGKALIRGQNFVGGAQKSGVTLDSPAGPVAISNVLVDDDKTIEIQIPASLPPGTYDVIVDSADSGNKGILHAGLTVTPKPPKTGCAAGPGGPGANPGGLCFFLLGVLLLPALRRKRCQ